MRKSPPVGDGMNSRQRKGEVQVTEPGRGMYSKTGGKLRWWGQEGDADRKEVWTKFCRNLSIMVGKWGLRPIVENGEPNKPLSQMWVLYIPDTSLCWIPSIGHRQKFPSHHLWTCVKR